MMGARNIIMLLSIVLFLGIANAQLFRNFCPNLFQTPVNAADAQLLSISIIIVLFVLTLLGIAYAMGYGFGIESLKTYSKTEFLESVFNLALIVLAASGVAFAGGAIAFISNIGGIGLQTFSSGASSALGVDMAICNNYVNNGVEVVLPYVLGTTGTVIALSSMKSIKIDLAPNHFGFTVLPFAGIGPEISIINIELGFFITMVAMFFFVPLLLYMIYTIFPIFFYAGILLRSFPWTRAAGGSFIALFIGFYIVFPALMYPFSTYTATTFSQIAVGSLTGLSFSSMTIAATTGFTNMFFTRLGFPNPLILEIKSFGSVVGGLAIELLGIVVSLIVSLDFIEVLGDLLGSPSLSSSAHTRKLLSKVI
jgi:hypothetical protein